MLVWRQASVFLGSFSTDLFITFLDHFFIDLIGTFVEEVGKKVSWIFRHSFAQVDEALREVRNNIVHEVLSDGLGALVK